MFGRENNKVIHKTVNNFNPYFYYIHPDGNFKSIFGKKCKKKIVFKPSDIYIQKKEYEHLEADVSFTNRYLIDKFDNFPEQEIRKCYIDIETEIKGDFPDVMVAPNKILSICCYDTILKKFVVFCLPPDLKENEKKDNNVSIYYFSTEEKLLKTFCQFIGQTDPDMFIAWNGAGFDFPYILNRFKYLGGDIKKLSRLNYSFCKKDRYGLKTHVSGRILFDLMQAYIYISQGKRESYALDYISNYELGEKKLEYDGDLNNLYNDNFKKYVEYNIQDVNLMILLDNKLKLVEVIDSLRKFARCNWKDCFSNSKMLDSIFLKYSKDKFILPSNVWANVNKIKGAFVWNVIPNFYNNIAVLDWKSLYPNIIRTFELSPEMILNKYEDNCITVKNKHIENLYIKKGNGFIPYIIDNLLDVRTKYKKLMNENKVDSQNYKTYDMIQKSAKAVASSVYGVLKDKCRISDKRIAEAITTMGQDIVKKAAQIAHSEGFKVIYGDTDSIFVEIKDHTKDDLENLSKTITKEIGVWVKKEFNCSKNTLEMEFEKIYSSLIFLANDGKEFASKKRYAAHMTWKDGKKIDKINIVGFESVRSDSPAVVRKFQAELFELILRHKDKDKTIEFINNFRKKFYVYKNELGIPVGISKSAESYKNLPIHIRAAKTSNERHNTNFRKGSRFKLVYIKKQPLEFNKFENVIAFKASIPEGYEIDYDKMYDRLITKKIKMLFTCLKWNMEGIDTMKKNQTDLSNF